jgi:uncharacterized membrane-anchored protein
LPTTGLLKKEKIMKPKNITWIAFAILVLLQLWVPAAVILEKENTLATGATYKFKTAPVDPNDYLRGKYIFLQFDQNRIKVNNHQEWKAGQTVYVNLGVDTSGFAKIVSIQKDDHQVNKNHIKTIVSYVNYQPPYEVVVEWPFERFYMEESKAPLAEEAYNKLRADSTQVSYALVKVKKGDAVLANVYINDQPIDAFIKK